MNLPEGAWNENGNPIHEKQTEQYCKPLDVVKVCDCGGIMKAHGYVFTYYKCGRCGEIETIN